MAFEEQLAGQVVHDDKDYEKLKAQMESLRLEKEELLKLTAGGTKNVTGANRSGQLPSDQGPVE